jgi:geranylgeranyl pyrophosphate synthase
MPDPSFSAWRVRIEAVLDRALAPATDSPQHLHAAMRHAALDGGKRMRPLLVVRRRHRVRRQRNRTRCPAAARSN